MKAVKIIITVLLAIILTVVLFSSCVAEGVRRQISEEGINDISERLDIYGSLSENLKKEGKTLEKWLEEQSDNDLLTRINYSEEGLRAVSALGAIHVAVKDKIGDYVSDFYNGNGEGKITKEEILDLANSVTDDLETYLDYKVEPSDIQDLEEYLDTWDLSKFELKNIMDSVPALKLAAKILSSNILLYIAIAVAAVIALLIILVNRNGSALVAAGVSSTVAGCLLLLIKCGEIFATAFTSAAWTGVVRVILDTLNIFFSYMLWGGIIFVSAGIILIIVGAVMKKKADAR